MKLIMMSIYILMISSLSFISCKSADKKTNKAPTSACDNLNYQYSGEKSEGFISYNEAKAMSLNYQSDSDKMFVRGIVGFDGINHKITRLVDSRSVWFPLEKLKKYIWYIENQSCQHASCADSLGIRLYFAKYPGSNELQNGNLKTVNALYANHQTIFMIPTFRKDGIDKDFNPEADQCQDLLMWARNQPESSKKIPLSFIFTPINGENHGGLIPPDNPAGAAFNQ